VGVAFPPAELVGGALDLVGGALDGIGELFGGDKKKEQAKASEQKAVQQQKQQIKAVPVITTQPTAIAQTQ